MYIFLRSEGTKAIEWAWAEEAIYAYVVMFRLLVDHDEYALLNLM